MKGGVVRLGISLDPELRDALDRWSTARNAGSRSEALRFLVRQELAAHRLADPDGEAVATVTLLFRHDDPNVLSRLTAAEHRWGTHVRSSTHVHLGGGACVEALILAGTRREIEAAAEDLRGVKGILQGQAAFVSLSAAGGTVGSEHEHPGPPGEAHAPQARRRRGSREQRV